MKHRGRTTDNAVHTKGKKQNKTNKHKKNKTQTQKKPNTKGKKSNYKPGKQTSGTLKHFHSLEWKAVTMGITMCQFQPSLIGIILAQSCKQS